MAKVSSMTVKLSEVVDIDEMIEDILYCSECGSHKEQFVPGPYPEELKCTCVEEDSTDDEYLYW